MTRTDQINAAWSAAFGRLPNLLTTDPGLPSESYSIEGIVIVPDLGLWLVGVEMVVWNYSRWEPPDYDVTDDSNHPTFEAALARAVEIAREQDARIAATSTPDEATPF